MLRKGSFFLILALSGCFFAPPPPSAAGYLYLTQADNPDGYSDPAYACVGERVQVRYIVEGTPSATLSADPADVLAPALSATQVSGEKTLEFEVLGPTTLLLDYQEGVSSARLELVPADICTGFPIDLLRYFTGTLVQSTPTQEALSRQLAFYWNEAGLGATLSGGNTYGDELQLSCSADSETDTLSCAGIDANFTLNAAVSANGLTGDYGGSLEGSVSSSTFSGTFDFR